MIARHRVGGGAHGDPLPTKRVIDRMSYKNASQSIQLGELARATEGLTQWRPLVMGFASLLVAGLIMACAGKVLASMMNIGGMIVAGLLWLVAVIVLFGGVSAVGSMLMDRARNMPVRSFGDAAMFGLLCIPKFLLFAILLAVGAALFAAFAALLYMLCKIPYLGALLAFFIHPALVLVAAFLLVVITFVAMPLFAPAVWSGLSFKEALASLFAIAQKRLVQVVLMLIALYVIMLVVMGLLFAGFLPAASGMTTMAMGIIPSYAGFGAYGMSSLMRGDVFGLMGAFTSGGVAGAMAGLSVLMTAVAALLMQVWLMGLNLLYIQAAEGVDVSQASSGIGHVMGDIAQRAKTAKDSAMAAAERAKQAAVERAAVMKAAQERAQAERQAQLAAQAQAAQAAENETSAVPQAAVLQCPACSSSVQASDAFCGECGHRLHG